jgi:iron(III) transport system ATP-binding protein
MLKVTDMCKEFPNEHGNKVYAAQHVTFEVEQGKLFTLLGPSGCGKTTTLRSIAGLEKPTSGEIEVFGRLLYSSDKKVFVAPNQREIGMVFQSYAIWPHMNVFQNAAFPLKVGKTKYTKKQLEDKVLRALHVVALDGLESRESTKLSGGQQQRLALARALVMEPQLLLLDEPLSNLDAKLRERMRFELKRLQRELGITTIYVTHDQNEALALSNQIAVMQAGRIMQIGTPREIYELPANEFVADFIGNTNFLKGRVTGANERQGYHNVSTSSGSLVTFSMENLHVGDPVVVSIRPENIDISLERPDSPNVWEAVVDTEIFLGESMDIQLRSGDFVIQARTHPSVNYSTGTKVYLKMNVEKCVAMYEKTEVASIDLKSKEFSNPDQEEEAV